MNSKNKNDGISFNKIVILDELVEARKLVNSLVIRLNNVSDSFEALCKLDKERIEQVEEVKTKKATKAFISYAEQRRRVMAAYNGIKDNSLLTYQEHGGYPPAGKLSIVKVVASGIYHNNPGCIISNSMIVATLRSAGIIPPPVPKHKSCVKEPTPWFAPTLVNVTSLPNQLITTVSQELKV